MSENDSPRSIRVPAGNIVQSIGVSPGGNLFVLAADYAEHPGRDIIVLTPAGDNLGRVTLPEVSSKIWISPVGQLLCIQRRNASVVRYEFDGGIDEIGTSLRR
jgi:hypothetical protein